MRQQHSSSRSRERKLRMQYRRNIKIAIVLSLIIGLAAGFLAGDRLGPTLLHKDRGPAAALLTPFPATDAPSLEPSLDPDALEETPAPGESPESSVAPLSLDLSSPVADTPSPAPTEVPEPTATPVPEDVVVPFDNVQTVTAQIYEDGTVRRSADDQPHEDLTFALRVLRYLTPEYYQANYSDSYQILGDEAGVEFELTLMDYTGSATINPQDILDISLETATGVSEQGYQLIDAEIHGNNKVSVESGVPTLLYKRFKYSEPVGDMAYLTVTAFKDGVPTKFLFEVGDPIRPVITPTPAPVYETLANGASGDAVVELQAKLIELGYLTGSADGSFGRMTEQAVKDAQSAFGMTETGIADNEFQQKLFAESSATAE